MSAPPSSISVAIVQASEVDFELRVAPAERLAQRSAGEAHAFSPRRLLGRPLAHVAVYRPQQAPRARRQLIEGAAEHGVGEAIGERDV